MRARVKSHVLYRISSFLGDAKVYIDCWPQQRWEYSTEKGLVRLERKGLVLYLPKEDFEKRWIIVDDSKKNADLPGQMRVEDYL